MVFVNKDTGGYRRFAPQSDLIISNAGPSARPIERNNLFYLNGEHEPVEVKTFSDYQRWVERGWKQQHGTYEASQRFMKKLGEESKEAMEAFDGYKISGFNQMSESAKEFLSELGDVLWCLTALSSNSSADIDNGLKQIAYEYVMGVRQVQDGRKIAPVWRDQMVDIATGIDDISIEKIDLLINQGFEPLPSTRMNMTDEIPDVDLDEHILRIVADAVLMRSVVERQYQYGEKTIIMPESYDELCQDISKWSANGILNIAYVASTALGVGLSGVISKNISKIESRVEAGRVDKTDGDRTSDLL